MIANDSDTVLAGWYGRSAAVSASKMSAIAMMRAPSDISSRVRPFG